MSEIQISRRNKREQCLYVIGEFLKENIDLDMLIVHLETINQVEAKRDLKRDKIRTIGGIR